jgi:hypothetical protein
MDKFRKDLLHKSGIEEILKVYNVQPENFVTSKNITLFIGFEKIGKRELIARLNGTNSLAYDLTDDFSENVVQKMASTITLSKVLEATRSIKLVVVYRCEDLDNPKRSIQNLLESLYYFLRTIVRYKEGVGMLLTNNTCRRAVEEGLSSKPNLLTKVLGTVFKGRVGITTDHQLHAFLKDRPKFQEIFAGNFHLHTLQCKALLRSSECCWTRHTWIC